MVWFTTGTSAIALFADILGMSSASMYLIGTGDGRFRRDTILSTLLVYGTAAGGMAGLLVGWLPRGRSLAFTGFEGRAWAALIALNILGLVLLGQARGLLLGDRHFFLAGGLMVVKNAAYAICAAGGMFVLGWNDSKRVAITQVLSTWVCATVFIAWLARGGLGAPSLFYFRECLGIGWRASLVNGLSYLQLRADQYMVYSTLGPAAMGLYGVAVSWGELLTFVPAMVGMVVLARAPAEKNSPGAARMAIKRAGTSVLLVGIVGTLIALLARHFIPLLYGPSFLFSATLLWLYLPVVIILSGLYFINSFVSGSGYPLAQVAVVLIAVVLNILCCRALLPRYGLPAAPLSVGISYGAWLFLLAARVLRQARPEVRTAS